MTVVLGSNISSLGAQRQLLKTSSALESVYERLSSGQRINRASDDAAGLAVSSALQVDTRLYNQSVRNLNDGVSFLNIADGALSEATGILERLKELSIQSANGIYSDEQRNALDIEAQALSEEYSRILASTEFNGKSVFSTDATGTNLQIGISGTDKALDIDFRKYGEVTNALGTYTTEDESIPGYGTVGDSQALVTDFNNDGIDDIVYAQISNSGSNNYFEVSVIYGSESGTYTDDSVASDFYSASTGVAGELYLGYDGNNLYAQFVGASPAYAWLTSSSGSIVIGSISGGTIIGSGGAETVYGDFNNDSVQDYAAIIGSGATLTTRVYTQETTTSAGYEAFDLDSFSLITTSDALSAQSVFDDASEQVQAARGKIGASLSRIQSALNLNTDIATQYEAANSRIADADIAEESSKLVRLNILQQASSAVLAQANQQPALALRLLSNPPPN